MLELIDKYGAQILSAALMVVSGVIGWLGRGVNTDIAQNTAIGELKKTQDEHGVKITKLEIDFKKIDREIISILSAQERQEEQAEIIHEHTKDKLNAIDKRFDGIDESIGKLVDKHDSGNSAILEELRKLNR